MKRLLLILMILILADHTSAQDSLALKQQYYYQYLNDSTANRIEYGCTLVGNFSENLFLIRSLISENRYDIISSLLDSKTASTRYLAAVSIMQAEKKTQYKPDSLTVLKMKSILQDNAEIYFCSGRSGRWSYSIKQLLDKKEKTAMAKWTKDWIDESFKRK